jgi:serine/threonine-protein kinase RCK2
MHEGRSPGLATLKEAFDITYAVHRMEEEGARRRKYNGRGGAGPRGFLGGLNEDDEDDEVEEDQVPGVVSGTIRDAGRAGARGTQPGGGGSRRTPKNGFELDLDGATLLERRHQRRRAPVGMVTVSSPLSGKSASTSPLKLEGLRVGEGFSEETGMRGVDVHMA